MPLQKENRILKYNYLRILDSIFLLHLPPTPLHSFSHNHPISLPNPDFMLSLFLFFNNSLAPILLPIYL